MSRRSRVCSDAAHVSAFDPIRLRDLVRRTGDVTIATDQSSSPRTAPHRLMPSEVRVIKDMVTSSEYRHVPTGSLAVLAQRLGRVWAFPSTWYHLVRTHGWHIDTTVIRLLDGTAPICTRRSTTSRDVFRRFSTT